MRGSRITETVPEQIARFILEDAASGWKIDAACMELANTCFGIGSNDPTHPSDPDDLDSETLSACSAMLFPNENLQRRLEPILLRERLSPQDVERIGSILEETPLVIRCWRERKEWHWLPHPSLIPVYLERFHMSWRIDRTLLRGIVRASGKRQWVTVMVRLRNRRFPATALQTRLLLQFLKEADTRRLDSSEWMNVVDFLTETIPKEPSLLNVWELIEDRRQFWIRMYDQAMAADLRREQFPMETWMMAKTPMGSLAKEEIVGWIEACERLLSMQHHRPDMDGAAAS